MSRRKFALSLLCLVSAMSFAAAPKSAEGGDLKVINNDNSVAFVAISVADNQGFRVVGWTRVAPGEQKTVYGGPAQAVGVFIYNEAGREYGFNAQQQQWYTTAGRFEVKDIDQQNNRWQFKWGQNLENLFFTDNGNPNPPALFVRKAFYVLPSNEAITLTP